MSSAGANIVVKHTEYIADVSSQSAAFAVTGYSINPGLNVTFPWLANLGLNFESYKFRKLHFQYKPICPTTTPGKVMLAVDYDAADLAPNSKVVINSYESSASSSVWDECTQISTLSNLLKFGVQRYVRTGAVPANTDIKTYDVGKLYVATSNTPATATTLGELYVSYEVELLTPQLSTSTVNQDGQSGTPPVWWQLGRIVVDQAGVASLSAEFYNQVLYLIGQQQIVGGKTIVDILINPTVAKYLRVDFSGPTAATIGLPTGVSNAYNGNSPVNYLQTSGGFSVNVFSSTSNYNRSWITPVGRPYDAASSPSAATNVYPGYRLSLPFGTTSNLNINGIDGAPDLGGPMMNQISADLPFPTISDVPINWAGLTVASASSSTTYGSNTFYRKGTYPVEETAVTTL